MLSTEADAFATLGLCADATLPDVRTAFRRLALRLHPDRGGETDAFLQLTAAFDLLNGAVSDSAAACGAPSRRADVVRGLLVTSGGVVLTLDEATLTSTDSCRGTLLPAEAEGSLLCCCLLRGGERVAIGTAKGRVRIADVGVPTRPAMSSLAVGEGPVLALASPPASPHQACDLLLASVGGELVLLDVVAGCVLRSLAGDLFGELRAECACPCALPAPATELVGFAAGGGGSVGGGTAAGGGEASSAGRLVCLSADAAGTAIVEWDVALEQPVYAVGASAPACGDALVAAATGGAVALYAAHSGAAIRTLRTGPGVLLALAFSDSGGALLAAGSEEVVHAFNVPAGTTRAALRLRRGTARDCHLNTAAITSLAFLDADRFLSGGYDAAVTQWQLAPQPRPPPVELRNCAACPSAANCDKGRAALAAAAAGVPAVPEPTPPSEVDLQALDW